MKICPNCGTSLNDNEKFCKNCGTKQAEESAVQNTQQEQSFSEQKVDNSVQPQNAGTCGFAIASLVLGIVTWILGWFTFAIPGILGIIFGALAMSQCKKTGKSGYGMAVAGFVISIIMVVIFFIWLILIAVAAVTYVNSFDFFF